MDYVLIFFKKIDGNGTKTARVAERNHKEFCKWQYSRGWKVQQIQPTDNPMGDVTPVEVTMNGRYSCD